MTMMVKVRAVIVHDGRLVVAREERRHGSYLALPGGRVKRWESITDALVREVREETGLAVEPERLLYVAEANSRYVLEDLDLVFLSPIRGPVDERTLTLVDLS